MKRVLLVSEAKAIGGAEVYLERLALHLAGYRPAVAVPRALHAWAGRMVARGIDVVPYVPGSGGLAAVVRAARGADLVHVNLPSTYDGGWGLWPWFLRRAAPVVVTEHLTRIPRSRRREWVKRWTAGGPGATICVSEASALVLRDRGIPRVCVVANGVPDPGEPDPPPPGPLRIGALSTHEPRKRLHLLIEAMRHVPHGELHLAGDGPLRGELEQRAQASPAASRIHFHGRVEDPYAFLRDQHVLALSSELEAMPLSILEALAAGRGVLSSRLPGIDEVLTPECGRLVAADDAETWGKAMAGLTEADVLSLGRAARQRYLEAFTLDRWIRDTEAVYRRVLEGRA